MVGIAEQNCEYEPLGFFDRFVHNYAKSGWSGSRLLWAIRNRVFGSFQSNEVNRVILPNGFTMNFDPIDWTKRSILEGTYQRALLNLLETIKFNGVVVDVGANIGVTLWHIIQNSSTRTSYLAFEPSPQCKGDLMDLTLRIPNTGKVFGFALGDKNEIRKLFGLNNHLHSGLASLFNRPDLIGDSEDVEVRTLDEVFASEKFEEEVAVLKIDAEGYEGKILKGADQLILGKLIQSFIIEISPNFGPIDFVDDLHDKLGSTYIWFEVKEEGLFRKKPTLQQIFLNDIHRRTSQFDIFVVKRSIYQSQMSPSLETKDFFMRKNFKVRLKETIG
jgi:FkbM family methyltransferase